MSIVSFTRHTFQLCRDCLLSVLPTQSWLSLSYCYRYHCHYSSLCCQVSSSSFILLQPFEIAIQTTYKKQITWNGNNGRTL